MNVNRLITPVRIALALSGAVLLLVFSVYAEQTDEATGCSPPKTKLATEKEVKDLPRIGRVRSATAPPKALFGMIWNDTTTNREYIFDGSDWVPHDDTVDAYYAAKKASKPGNGGGQ